MNLTIRYLKSPYLLSRAMKVENSRFLQEMVGQRAGKGVANIIFRREIHRCFSTNFRVQQAKAIQSDIERIDLSKFTKEERALLDRFVRVDQAGETTAIWIYRGQNAILGKNKHTRELLKHMESQEAEHLDSFNKKITTYNARPTIFQPAAAVGGFFLGSVTALMGKNAAMACTEAVETEIGLHYNNQLRELLPLVDKYPELKKLIDDIKLFRDQELEHLDTAVEHGAHQSIGYTAVNQIIRKGCKVAIWMAERF